MKLLLLLLFAISTYAQDPVNRLAPNVPSPQEIVDRMLEAANLHRGEVVYDLGCGEGRILITAVQKFDARAVGIEIDPKLVQSANELMRKIGIQNRARVIQADIFNVDLSPADVVTLYLTTSFNEKLRPKFEQSLRPGTRVISHDYNIRGWNPVDVQEVMVHNRRHRIFVYHFQPAKK